MREKFLKAFAFLFALSLVAAAANIPFFPSGPAIEASQVIPTLNQLIAQLSGLPGYAPAQVQPYSIGSLCTASGASPQTCNGQRGLVVFTGVTVASNSGTVVSINNNFVTSAQGGLGGSSCEAHILNFSGTIGTNGVPFVANANTTAAGTLTIVLGNASANTTGSQSFNIGFNCFS